MQASNIKNNISRYFNEVYLLPFKQPFNKSGLTQYWRLLFNVSLIVLAIAMPVLSQDFGITVDEVLHNRQAELVEAYFKKGNNEAVNQPRTLLHLYGQSFDYFCLKANEFIGNDKLYETRHVLISIAGFFCFYFISLITLRLSGYKTALLSLLLCVASPTFFGHCMNNSVDIPFALAFAGTLYFIIRQIQVFPFIQLKHSIGLMVFIALGISIRAGGLLLIAYSLMTYGFLFLVHFYKKRVSQPSEFPYKKVIISFVSVSVIAYFLSIQFWPYALKDPIHNPFKALTEFSNISTTMKQLFEGKRVYSIDLPGYYLVKFMVITIPVVVITGLSLFVLLLFRNRKAVAVPHPVLIISIGFPIIYAYIMHSNVYSSWRHFLFVYPGIVVLAALGWNYLSSLIVRQWWKYGVSVVIIVLFIHPLRFMIKAHPMEYVYFNEFVGGTNEAWKYYETDYYAGALLGCTNWLKEQAEFKNRKDTLVIATTSAAIVNYYLKNEPKIKVRYIIYQDRQMIDWDYGIFYLEHISPYQLQHKLWPPAGTIYAYKTDEAVTGVVLKKFSDKNYLGFKALQTGQYNAAIQYYQEYLKLEPGSESARAGLAEAYYGVGNYNAALTMANEALANNPDYVYPLQVQGMVYLANGNIKEAIKKFELTTSMDRNFVNGFYYLSLAYYNNKEADKAIDAAKKTLDLNKSFFEAAKTASMAYSMKGDQDNAKYYYELYYKLQGLETPKK